MKKIVIIGANSFQNPLILKAKEMGFETHVFAWKDGSIGEETADYFYPISIVEKEQILEVCKRIQPAAVVTIASDLANITVQYLAKQLGLVCNSEECILRTTNKYVMRKALREGQVPTPAFAVCSGPEEAAELVKSLSFPIIVKPTDRSGSRGIMKLYDVRDLDCAIEEATRHSFEKKAIIEEYIEGEEYSCECISFRGKHYILAYTKKYTTGAPHFIETGHQEPAGFDPAVQEKIKDQIFHALDALQIQYGASHTEFKLDAQNRIQIIEIGSRMGGDCIGSDLVRLSTGQDYVRMVIETALGTEPVFEPVGTPKMACIRFVFSPKDIRVLKELKEKHPEQLVFVSEMDVIGDHEITDSSTRYGYYIFTCDTWEEAEEYMEE